MCYRYYIGKDLDFAGRYDLESLDRLVDANYNISPASYQPIIVNKDNINKLVHAKWGLIPFWTKDPEIGFKLANARSETIDEKSSFKKAFKTQRCLVPASGFYEWEKVKSQSLPYLIKLKDEQLFSFAGIYDFWSNPKGGIIATYSILTTKPNALIKNIHDRMPVILPKELEDFWIQESDDYEGLKEILKPIDEDRIEMHRVSTEVNKPGTSGEKLIKPI